jgi:hypothetical protein
MVHQVGFEKLVNKLLKSHQDDLGNKDLVLVKKYIREESQLKF